MYFQSKQLQQVELSQTLQARMMAITAALQYHSEEAIRIKAELQATPVSGHNAMEYRAALHTAMMSHVKKRDDLVGKLEVVMALKLSDPLDLV